MNFAPSSAAAGLDSPQRGSSWGRWAVWCAVVGWSVLGAEGHDGAHHAPVGSNGTGSGDGGGGGGGLWVVPVTLAGIGGLAAAVFGCVWFRQHRLSTVTRQKPRVSRVGSSAKPDPELPWPTPGVIRLSPCSPGIPSQPQTSPEPLPPEPEKQPPLLPSALPCSPEGEVVPDDKLLFSQLMGWDTPNDEEVGTAPRRLGGKSVTYDICVDKGVTQRKRPGRHSTTTPMTTPNQKPSTPREMVQFPYTPKMCKANSDLAKSGARRSRTGASSSCGSRSSTGSRSKGLNVITASMRKLQKLEQASVASSTGHSTLSTPGADLSSTFSPLPLPSPLAVASALASGSPTPPRTPGCGRPPPLTPTMSENPLERPRSEENSGQDVRGEREIQGHGVSPP
eukprot:Hpha_TRINITY_DN14510_c1_g1::TRINITY_DN14510_c1_g1_i1::g.46944::m.46944